VIRFCFFPLRATYILLSRHPEVEEARIKEISSLPSPGEIPLLLSIAMLRNPTSWRCAFW
jgi:hypothetical protein